jgi:hypothetical protein
MSSGLLPCTTLHHFALHGPIVVVECIAFVSGLVQSFIVLLGVHHVIRLSPAPGPVST